LLLGGAVDRARNIVIAPRKDEERRWTSLDASTRIVLLGAALRRLLNIVVAAASSPCSYNLARAPKISNWTNDFSVVSESLIPQPLNLTQGKYPGLSRRVCRYSVVFREAAWIVTSSFSIDMWLLPRMLPHRGQSSASAPTLVSRRAASTLLLLLVLLSRSPPAVQSFGWSHVVVQPLATASLSGAANGCPLISSDGVSHNKNRIVGPLSASSTSAAEHDVGIDQVDLTESGTNVEEGGGPSTTETLVFTGDFAHLSDPIPKSRRSELAAFLRRDEAKHLLLSVGGKRPATRRELSKELLDLWVESCSDDGGYGDASLPDPDVDEVISSESIVNFPGLKMTSVIYSGTKLRTTGGDTSDSLPSHEFVMVAEQQRVEGPPPMVWLYRKLTGNDKSSERGPKLSKGRARSRVSIVETDDGTSLALSFATELQIRVDFPRFLVKALPTTKEKMEEQGSAAVLKTVSQDIKDAVAATREAFLNQLASAASTE
jgi:hypothetical protein